MILVRSNVHQHHNYLNHTITRKNVGKIDLSVKVEDDNVKVKPNVKISDIKKAIQKNSSRLKLSKPPKIVYHSLKNMGKTADRTLMSPYRGLSLATFFGCAPALDPNRDPKSFLHKHSQSILKMKLIMSVFILWQMQIIKLIT